MSGGAGAGGRILVTGAAGFIGRHTVAALLQAGLRVRVFVRGPERAARLAGVEVALGHMNDQAALQAACLGCSGVIHLAAQTRDAPDSEPVNVGGARCLIEACRAAGCKRIVVVSTQSAKIAVQGDYARTKAAADALFLGSGLDVTVLLPSVVYGTADDGIFGTLRRVVASHRVVPVLGDGRWRSAPVHVDDVAQALVRALREPAAIGQRYDIGGREQLSFDQLLDRIAAALGRPAPVKLHVPLSVSLAAASVLKRLMRTPPITRSNVLGSNQDTAIDIAPACRDLGLDPLPLAEGLARVFPAIDPAPALLREARALARYLIGAEISPELAQRYLVAHQKLLPAVVDPVTACARRHPWLLGPLDAAAGPLGTIPPLRRRLLLMANLLEATPEYAVHFLPVARSRTATVLLLGWHGARAVLLALVGLPLHLTLGGRRRDG